MQVWAEDAHTPAKCERILCRIKTQKNQRKKLHQMFQEQPSLIAEISNLMWTDHMDHEGLHF